MYICRPIYICIYNYMYIYITIQGVHLASSSIYCFLRFDKRSFTKFWDMLCIQLLILVHSIVWEPSTKRRTAKHISLPQNNMQYRNVCWMPHAKDGTCFTHRVDKTQLFVVFVSRLLVCDDHLFFNLFSCCPQHLGATCLSLGEAGLRSLVVLDARSVTHRSFIYSMGLGYKTNAKKIRYIITIHFTPINIQKSWYLSQ